MEELILEDLVEFQWFGPFLKKEERRVLNTKEIFQKLADWTFKEYLGIITILKEEFEEVGFIKLVDDLKFLNFI